MKAIILMEIPTQVVEERINQLADAGEKLVLMTGHSDYKKFFEDQDTKIVESQILGTAYTVVIETTHYYIVTPSLNFGDDTSGTRVLIDVLRKLGANSPIMESQLKDSKVIDVKVGINSFTFEKSLI